MKITVFGKTINAYNGKHSTQHSGKGENRVKERLCNDRLSIYRWGLGMTREEIREMARAERAEKD